ncbi:phytanoyl-CoA dioxygenase family protein [Paraburkholderia sp. MMS20-SJTN17]|uniref:Phytanoyl-CoA dioxygenase family protein n=1 Tax=Paraburkholderia translucens TaxID=2886945 RepID=A0ABS8KEC1_9BURK|nr:phytanoyl-CoA dioxygenase family protein [Paraburkholderia sp. MMS20-SJTN17]MCC8403111.1 phytanoyl-CoA dioxygenase family protein [Paraburkholderia sp. MMS20-SJTN17]
MTEEYRATDAELERPLGKVAFIDPDHEFGTSVGKNTAKLLKRTTLNSWRQVDSPPNGAMNKSNKFSDEVRERAVRGQANVFPTFPPAALAGTLRPIMYKILSPIGTEIEIPENAAQNSTTFDLTDLPAAKRYYEENGYVVVRGVVDQALCDSIRSAFEKTVKPYPGYIYRQATANPEKNRINEYGFVMNSLLNLQSLNDVEFAPLKKLAIKTFSSTPVKDITREIFAEDGKLVQSMYFEGNSETWPHQDTYYLDSERIGTMLACWYALEDIDAGAGRFFVVPRSHRIDMVKNGKNFDVAFNHGQYKELVKKILSEQQLEFRAPFLQKGDVLIWNAKTIHGSLRTTRPQFSRSSLTSHFIPASHRFLQFQSKIKPLNLREFDGMLFHCPKDMERLSSRVVLGIETTFPKTFQMAKKLAIKAVVK